jgi:osmotically-inducible protein OsmY
VDEGVVTLTEHDEAIEAAWAVSGVRDVEDRIRVKPPSTTED